MTGVDICGSVGACCVANFVYISSCLEAFEHTYANMAAIFASDLVKASKLAWDIYNYGFAKECNASK